MRQVHDYNPGQRIPNTHWTFVRYSTPRYRSGKTASTVLVKCLCGREDIKLKECFTRSSPESTGCKDPNCRALRTTADQLYSYFETQGYPASESELRSAFSYLISQTHTI